MASIKYTKNTADAILKAHRLPTVANSRPVGQKVYGGGGKMQGLWNATFSSDEGEASQEITLTNCYYGRGTLSANGGIVSSDPAPPGDDPLKDTTCLKGDMPAGRLAYVGAELNYSTGELKILVGTSLDDVSHTYYDPNKNTGRIPLYICTRGKSVNARWVVRVPLYLMPRLPVRI